MNSVWLASLIGLFIGALIMTLAISRLFLRITKTWNGGATRLITVHAVCLMLACLICGMGSADGGAFAPARGLEIYSLPQLIWLAFDLYRLERKPAAEA